MKPVGPSTGPLWGTSHNLSPMGRVLKAVKSPEYAMLMFELILVPLLAAVLLTVLAERIEHPTLSLNRTANCCGV
jgi:hypothetical protein